MIKSLLFSFLLIKLCVAQINEQFDNYPQKENKLDVNEYGVYNLKTNQFYEMINQTENFLVYLHVPWCSHCNQIPNDAANLIKQFNSSQINLKVGLLDMAQDVSISEEFGIYSFPTVFLYYNNQYFLYPGKSSFERIFSWTKKKIYQNMDLINDTEKINLKMTQKSPFVFAIFPDAKAHFNAEFTAFSSAQKQFEDISFAYSNSPSIAQYYSVKTPSLFISHSANSLKFYNGNLTDSESIRKFVKNNILPLINEFTPSTAQSIFKDSRDILLALNYKSEIQPTLYSSLENVARTYQDTLIVCTAGLSSPLEKKVFEYLNLDTSIIPAVYYLKKPQNNPIKYICKFPLTDAGLHTFIENVINKQIQPLLKSAPIPASQPGPIYELVSATYNEIITKSNKNIFVYFYTPWCDHCKIFNPIYKKLATHMMLDEYILIAQIDASANELEVDQINGYPALLYYPANNKADPIVYDGSLSFSALISFIHIHTVNLLKMDEL